MGLLVVARWSSAKAVYTLSILDLPGLVADNLSTVNKVFSGVYFFCVSTIEVGWTI